MKTLEDNTFMYVETKKEEYFERITHDNINRLIHLYEDISFPVFKEFFSSFHFHLNKLFKHLNAKLQSNGHYNAHESRSLMFLIEHLFSMQSTLKNTKYYFTLNSYYKELLDQCDKFLVDSGGSTIPDDFPKIDLIDAEPIFSFDNQVYIKRNDKKISFPTTAIGSGSYATVHKYKDDFYNRFFVIKKAMKNLLYIPFEFENIGTRVIHYTPEIYEPMK